MRFVDDQDDYGVFRTIAENMIENGQSRGDVEALLEEVLDELDSDEE